MGMTADNLMATLFPKLSKERHRELFDACCKAEDVYLRQHGGILFPGLEETLQTLSRELPSALSSATATRNTSPAF